MRRVALILGLVFLWAPIALMAVYAFSDSRVPFEWGGFSLRWFAANPLALPPRRRVSLGGRPKTTSWLGVGRESVAYVARATGMPRPAKLARQMRYARRVDATVAVPLRTCGRRAGARFPA